MKGLNENSLDRICASLAYAMGIEPPKQAAPALKEMTDYLDAALSGRSADRVFMYNPDAIAEWIYEKYAPFFKEVDANADLRVPLCSVMPSVTPVCFGTMYTGAQPEVHGIRKYEKPVITIDTIFDALLRAGKRVALVTYETCSLSKIYLERDIDYYHYDTMASVNAKAAELILRDEHDFIVVYNGNYDSKMHKYGPESTEALAELRCNVEAFSIFSEMIKSHWSGHDTLVGFAMDHGCHEIDGGCGSHGLDMPEDLNIVHLYKAYPKTTEGETL